MIFSALWWARQAIMRQVAPIAPVRELLSAQQLKAAMPYITKANIERYLVPLQGTLEKYNISTPQRIAHFFAQVGHETASFRYKEEIASGSQYDTGAKAKALGNTPEADGDGQRYKGRGAIQVTGLANYKACGKALGVDLVNSPELLATNPDLYILCAGWYWYTHGLNLLADADELKLITRAINGGFNGLADRRMRLMAAKKVFNIT